MTILYDNTEDKLREARSFAMWVKTAASLIEDGEEQPAVLAGQLRIEADLFLSRVN